MLNGLYSMQLMLSQWGLEKIKCVYKVSINNIPALVEIMFGADQASKPLSELMVVSVLTHLCVTRPHLFIHMYVLVITLYFLLCQPVGLCINHGKNADW